MGNALHDLMKDYRTGDNSLDSPISLGFTETNVEVVFGIRRLQHVLISGMSQSGKSTMVRKILPSLVQFADVAIFSTKDSDFIDFAEQTYLTAEVDQIGGLVRRTVGEVERRNNRLRDKRQHKGVHIKCEDRPWVILIDEFQSFIEMSDASTVEALKRLIREGAGLNVFLYIITQTPSKKVLSDGLRDNITTDIAFKQRDASGSRMAIGGRKAEFLELHQCWIRNVEKFVKLTRV